MKAARVAFVALMILSIPGIAAAEMEVLGYLENQMRARIAYVEEQDDIPTDLMMADTWFNLKFKAAGYQDLARMNVDLDLRHFGLEREENIEAQLREAWIGLYVNWFSFEIGKKIFSWGMADEMRPTDLLNPQDLRWFYTYDLAQRKIGVYSASVGFSFGNFRLTGVVLPLFRPTILPGSDENWTPWKLQLFYDFENNFGQFVDYDKQCYPDANLQNVGGAAKFSGVVGPVDFELSAFDGYDPLVTFDINIDDDFNNMINGGKPVSIREVYQRYNAFGGALSAAVNAFTLRAEGAYYTDRWYMYEFDEDLVNPPNLLVAFESLEDVAGQEFRARKPSFNAVGGFDYRYSNLIYTNLQYFHMQILDYDEILIDNEIENGITGKLEFSFLDETLKVAVDGAFNVTHEDWFAKPYINYLADDVLSLQLGAVFFGGDYETNFGEFDENDYVFTKVRINF